MDAKNLRAKDIMQTDVKTIRKDATLLEAAKIMMNSGISSLVIEPDGDWDAFGIITRKDIVEAFIDDPSGKQTRAVGEIMSKPAITVSTALSVYNCHYLMRSVSIRRLPVVDGSKLVGIISNSDIFQRLVKGKQRIAKECSI